MKKNEPVDSNPIRHIRASTGLSQAAFADKYGIPKRTVENWESGVNAPPQYVIDLLTYRIDHEKEQP